MYSLSRVVLLFKNDNEEWSENFNKIGDYHRAIKCYLYCWLQNIQ